MLKHGGHDHNDPLGSRGGNIVVFLALLGLFGLALALRLVAGVNYPFHPDAAYFAQKAEQVYHLGRMFDPRQVPTYAPIWPYLIAYTAGGVDFLARALGISQVSGLSVAEVYLPPVAGGLLALSTATFGRVLYDWRTGILAGFGAAVSPLVIAYSARGATDHDAFSLSLIVLTTAAFIACYRRPSSGNRKAVLRTAAIWTVPGSLFTISLLTWKGAIAVTLFVGVIVLAELLTRRERKERGEEGTTIKLLVAYTALFFLIPTVVGYASGINQGYNVVLSVTDIFGAISHYVLAFLAGLHLLPRGALSLLFPTVGEYQSQSWPVVIFFLGFFNVLAPLSIAPFLERPSKRDVIAMTFLVIMFATAFRSSDLTFMAVPFVSLASARFLSWLLEKAAPSVPGVRFDRPARSRWRGAPHRSFYLFVGLVALGPAALGLTSAVQYAQNPQNLAIMPSYWFGALDWMKTHTCNSSLIFTWWDYGYFVSYWGKRLPAIDNSYQPDARVIDVAKTVIGSDPVAAKSIMANYLAADKMQVAYYLITSDELALMPVIRYAATYNLTTGGSAGIVPVPDSILSNSLYYRLFYSNATTGSEPIDGFQLAYKSPEVQIYRVILPQFEGSTAAGAASYCA